MIKNKLSYPNRCFRRKNSLKILLYSVLVAVVVVFSSSYAQSAQKARISFVNLTGQLSTINSDGTDLRSLSEAPATYQFPAWSPDGNYIAAIGNDDFAGTLDIFEDRNSSDYLRIHSSRQEVPFYLYWSPNSNFIGFLANNSEEGIVLNLATLETSNSRLRESGNPLYWQWSSDSQKILMHQGLLGGRLGFIDTVGKTRLEENIDTPGFFRSPGISASGKYIAYASSGVRGSEIVLKSNPLSLGRKDVSRAFAHDGFTAMSWSPKDDNLAMILPKQDSVNSFGQLAMMDAESGLLETLVEESVVAFFWSPDGRYIMYLTPQRSAGNEFAYNREDLHSNMYYATTTKTTDTDSYLAQSDEIELAVNVVAVATAHTTYLTTIRPTTLFINQFIPYFEQYALSHNLWSVDSEAVVLPARALDGKSNIAVISVPDGELNFIAEGESPVWKH